MCIAPRQHPLGGIHHGGEEGRTWIPSEAREREESDAQVLGEGGRECGGEDGVSVYAFSEDPSLPPSLSPSLFPPLLT